MKRTVHVHCGPTNSGKTHNALTALRQSASGLYCGPLRLLAWEVHERLNAHGVPCSLLTGQEVIDIPEANHTSSTIEMAKVNAPVEVAVIDEIQV